MSKFRRRVSTKKYIFPYPAASGFNSYPKFLPFLGAILGLILVGAVFLTTDKTRLVPNQYHIVRVFDQGKQSAYPTKAETVGELIDKLNLDLQPQDVVEPSRDAEIVEDNFRVNVYRAQLVTVVDKGKRTVSLSAQRSARVLAQNAGIKLYPEDVASFEPGSVAENIIGQRVTIKRAVPVNLIVYGLTLSVRTQAKTVGDLLEEKEIELAKDDKVSVPLDTKIKNSMLVTVLSKDTNIKTAKVVIEAPTQYVDDASLSFGVNIVRQAGSDGSKIVTYKITTKDGREVSRKKIQQVVVVEPVAKIVARGTAVSVPTSKTAIMAAVGISKSDYQYVYYIINHENGMWCPTRWQGQNFCPATYKEKFPGAATSSQVGYGLCQSTPGSKMASAGADWKYNVVTQMKWCDSYATGRYGSWKAAYDHWINYRWW